MSGENKKRGFSVRVFLPDGDPDGIRVVEKSNWTGVGLVVPRALFSEAKRRTEMDRTGVYVLVGLTEVSPLPRVYIGEGDPIRPRLEQHGRKKEFWTHAVLFISKDQSLNKAHVQHLEARLVQLATASKRCVLDNANVPQPPSLSETDTAEIEGFLDDLLLCFPILGYGFFEAGPISKPNGLELFLRVRGLSARAFETSQGILVLKGSQAAKEEGQVDAYMREMRAELVRQGVFVDRGSVYELSQDYSFASPSTASTVLLALPSQIVAACES